MDDIHDYLQKKASELDLGRADELAKIQAYLDEHYPGQCRAVSLNDGVLKITTSNASVASELRYDQGMKQQLPDPPKRVQIQISGSPT